MVSSWRVQQAAQDIRAGAVIAYRPKQSGGWGVIHGMKKRSIACWRSNRGRWKKA